MTTELTLRFQAAPAVLFLQTQLPARMVVDLNKYLDSKHKKGGESFADKLVGQISHGEQLKMDQEDPLVQPFVQTVANMQQIVAIMQQLHHLFYIMYIIRIRIMGGFDEGYTITHTARRYS